MKRKILFVSAFALTSLCGFAQQDAAVTHFMYTKMAVNPGETGIEDGFCGNVVYRNQWDKVNGAPNSVVFNGALNLESYRLWSGGVGLSLVHDAIGFNRQTNVNLNYSHHFTILGGQLGVGVGVGLVSFGLNPVWVPPTTLADNSIPAGSSAMTIDANFGAFYKHNDWYAGISSTHLPAPAFSNAAITGTGNVEYNQARHYYVMGGYTFRNIGDGEIDAQTLIQTDAVETSLNLNARYIYKGFIYGGLAFRNSDAISALLGYRVIQKTIPRKGSMFWWVGYSYDLTINGLSSVSNGTHEMAMKFCFVPILPITKSKHVRWL